MGVETQKFIRKPLYVEAVRVSANNFDELVAWCNGEVQVDETPGSGTTKKFIKVRVHNPKNPRQTKAFIGDWLLYTERGYKVYTNRAFRQAFNSVTAEGAPVADATAETPESQEIPKFYFAPHSDELTETKPHKHAVPLTLPELTNIIRNELVGEELQNTTRPEEEPKKEPLPPQPRNVGGNVEIHDKRPESAVEVHETPQGEPHEYVEATPEAIADAVKEGSQEFAEEDQAIAEGQPEPVEEAKTVDEIIESHPDGPIAGMSEAAGEAPIAPEADLDDVAKGDPIPRQAPPDAAAGKRVLSEREQQVLGPDQVRELVSAGDVILAQDLAEVSQA